eukprot:1891651-Rhodomonas_salina.1
MFVPGSSASHTAILGSGPQYTMSVLSLGAGYQDREKDYYAEKSTFSAMTEPVVLHPAPRKKKKKKSLFSTLCTKDAAARVEFPAARVHFRSEPPRLLQHLLLDLATPCTLLGACSRLIPDVLGQYRTCRSSSVGRY